MAGSGGGNDIDDNADDNIGGMSEKDLKKEKEELYNMKKQKKKKKWKRLSFNFGFLTLRLLLLVCILEVIILMLITCRVSFWQHICFLRLL